MTSETTEEVNREKLLFDIIDYLNRHYDIDEQQITTNRMTVDSVSLTVHDAPDFPGFGSASVAVFEMSEELRYGYVPRRNGSEHTLRIWTEEPTAPDWE